MQPIRLWPALAIVAIASAITLITPFAFTRTIVHFVGVVGAPIVGTIAILVWWLAFSRVKGMYRWLPVLLFLVSGGLLYYVVYPDDKLKPLLFYAPAVALLWVLWLCISRRMALGAQLAGATAIAFGGWGLLSSVRIDELNAEMVPELRMAWEPSRKELFEREQAEHKNDPKPSVSATVEVKDGDWPEFRGPKRDGVALEKIRTDWNANAPKELWRRRVGAGWGSFAVVGDRVFTQEQRGNDEAVVCYHAATGYELWVSLIPGRFFEGIAGEGPRATPTIHDGKCYAFSATGKLVCLDAVSGAQAWLRDVTVDVEAKVPQWGFASSPLVIDGKVIVFAAAKEKGTVAYTLSGELAWARGSGSHGYSSPHRAVIHGEEQVLMVSDFGLEAFRPSDGALRWAREWKFPGQNRVAQPALLGNNEILLGTAVGNGQGAQRFRVNADWTTEKIWESRSPKPYFNDGVVFENHYYGWDDRNFVCLNLKSGAIKWNAGSGYGFGQVLLLPNRTLLVQAESGKVILLEANPAAQKVIAKLDALNDKTWNHPAVARGRLYVRNGAEAACYDVESR